jgi:D-serine deaminase-like pyridoxal phosphate-dependent protein
MKISKPTLILDKEKCIRNIQKMVKKAADSNVIFRPHFKTHQSGKIGELFREYGVDKITVSSVSMAKYFASNGWNDITIATPVNINETDEINNLAKNNVINLLITNVEAIEILENRLTNKVNIFIKIDTGYHRTGIAFNDSESIDKILSLISNSSILSFCGFLTHSGHTYSAKSIDEIKDIYNDTVKKMQSLKTKYKDEYPDLILSLGDTPSCSIIENFFGIDEIRPGNFVFYDIMQYMLGSCNIEDIAVSMACPVISKNADRLEIAVYCGAVHLSKEKILDKQNNTIYGLIVEFKDDKWSQPVDYTYLKSLTQEIGIIKTTESFLNKVNIGSVIGILPVHSCLTADLTGEYHTNENEIYTTMRKEFYE